MGGEVLVLGIIAMGTWLIPFFGLPVPIIGLVWGVLILRRRPAKKGMTISGVILSSIGLFLAVSYTIISVLGTAPDIFNTSPGNNDGVVSPPPGSVEWQADGVIEPGEYKNYQNYSAGVQIYWMNDDQFVYIGIKAVTEGWVAVSFIEELRSGGEDTIMGYADSSKQGHIFDLWASTQPDGTKENDQQLGGQSSMLDWAAVTIIQVDEEQDASNTVLEFRRRLSTGDVYDIQLLAGPNLIIWSVGSTDDINNSPLYRGYGVIELE
ncbi:dopamine beta hydroxylase-like protein [Dehalogenimonas sp. WBC-2]|nr:dopamine beta hydroxylase-like protein [Dehalogenimonas sp. WBC-2]